MANKGSKNNKKKERGITPAARIMAILMVIIMVVFTVITAGMFVLD